MSADVKTPTVATPKYALGEYVFVIYQSHEAVTEPCKVCEGTGRLMLAKGGDVACTEAYRTCYSGKVTVRHIMPWKRRESGTIGQVRTEVTAAAYRGLDDNGNPEHTEHEIKIDYMLDSTGVRSGSLWPEDQVWPTRETADAECERLNAAEVPQ